MTQLKQILIAARKLIETEEYWTQHSSAIENTGAECSPLADCAYAFCAAGAISRAAADLDAVSDMRFHASQRLALSAQKLFPETHGMDAYVHVNDGAIGAPEDAHANILRCFDHAIKAEA